MAESGFLFRDVAPFHKRVHRLGLSASYGIQEKDLEAALDHGLNFLYWTPLMRQLTGPLKRAIARRRESLVIASGPSLAFLGGSVRRACERRLRALGADYLDVFQLHWLSKMSAWTDGVVEQLVRLKEQGKVRAIGVSIHDRPRAGRLALDSPLDSFMLRYNAAHPGAERDIFPSLAARKPAVVAYTATSWRKLLKPPKGWTGPVMTAGDCYRFCLSSPHVDVVLTAPASGAQLRENLAALEKGPLSPEEDRWMRDFGEAVHG